MLIEDDARGEDPKINTLKSRSIEFSLKRGKVLWFYMEVKS